MRVLWLCNLIIPFFADEFGVKSNVYGGWMTGMLTNLPQEDFVIGLCFPIIDESRKKDGIKEGYYYFSYSADYDASEYDEIGEKIEGEFEQIINSFNPDVIHVWGTEYVHSYAMLKAATKCDLADHLLFHIQGLVSECWKYYLEGVPEEYLINDTKSLYDDFLNMKKRGEIEKCCLDYGKNFIGRTDWDKAHVIFRNPKANYYYCGEILRPEFYSAARWEPTDLPPVIFMSQGTYPIKGVHYALEAISLLKNKYPMIELHISGEDVINVEVKTPYAEYICELIKENGLEDNVLYIGKLSAEEMVKKLKDSSVYLIASTIENSPNSLSEAMMIGVPVIAAAVGGIPSIIRNESEGILYQFNDSYMLALKISEILENQRHQTELSYNEQLRARSFNSISENRECLISIYNRIMNGNGDK